MLVLRSASCFVLFFFDFLLRPCRRTVRFLVEAISRGAIDHRQKLVASLRRGAALRPLLPRLADARRRDNSLRARNLCPASPLLFFTRIEAPGKTNDEAALFYFGDANVIRHRGARELPPLLFVTFFCCFFLFLFCFLLASLRSTATYAADGPDAAGRPHSSLRAGRTIALTPFRRRNRIKERNNSEAIK